MQKTDAIIAEPGVERRVDCYNTITPNDQQYDVQNYEHVAT